MNLYESMNNELEKKYNIKEEDYQSTTYHGLHSIPGYDSFDLSGWPTDSYIALILDGDEFIDDNRIYFDGLSSSIEIRELDPYTFKVNKINGEDFEVRLTKEDYEEIADAIEELEKDYE